MVGTEKSWLSTAGGTYPATNAAVANSTIFITGIHNANAADATVKQGSDIATVAAAGTTVTKVKAGTSFNPATPIKLGAAKVIYTDKADVTFTFAEEGGPTITGPNGYPWDQTNDTFAGPFNYSY
jgi:hypothetical protein